ncbi:MAG: TonB-dependent receptor plug domain-containing protein [Saprospiraceae bacterium]|nr:TonB-dependent receptor plug domain-containing protein [Saprospiraceae bacterium]
MKSICTVFFCFIFILDISGQIIVRGIVTDQLSGETLPGAIVVDTSNVKNVVIAGLDGSFKIKLFNQSRSLSIHYSSYESVILNFNPYIDTFLLVKLKPKNNYLMEVIISGAKSEEQTDISSRIIERNALGVLNLVSARTMEVSPDLTVANVIQRISGVTIERNNTGDGQFAILRGMDKRYNYTLVNGIKIPSPDNKNRFVPLDIFPSELLARLEVNKSLSANMEGDGIGGSINLVMKDAPSEEQWNFNLSTGYNALFFRESYLSYNHTAISAKSPYELYGENYPAKVKDFNAFVYDTKTLKPLPNLFSGLSYGRRFLNKRFGLLFAGTYQNSFRGNLSRDFSYDIATSDASNLPVLTKLNARTYSEQQVRYGIHGVLDYRIAQIHKFKWYNGWFDLKNFQVRDEQITDYSIGYDPKIGNYNLSYDLRNRKQHQTIYNSTLSGDHAIFHGYFKLDWSIAFSKAYNELPDNSSLHTVTTVKNFVQNPISVVTLGGAERRWEHNSDDDKAIYVNAQYKFDVLSQKIILFGGTLQRAKERSNFYNEYYFRPYDEDKPDGSKNNLIKDSDWSKNSEIKFVLFNPFGSIGNQLNYDASEKIQAYYTQARWGEHKLQILAGIRVEHTIQGYDLKYPIGGVKNSNEQKYQDWLPSINFKYSPTSKSYIKSSYFKSINRPSFFEIVPYKIIHEEFTETGNPDLRHTVADNLDFRFEYFGAPGEQFLLGLFYKRLIDPIEFGTVAQGQGTSLMPTNYGNASNFGLELDFTKYFYSIGIKTNYTFTKSEITTNKLYYIKNQDQNSTENVLVKSVNQTRPLNGQSAHVGNLSLLYKGPKVGLEVQLALNYTSERIFAVSRFLDLDIWQAGRFQLDASMEKSIGSKFTGFCKLNNILNAPNILYVKKPNAFNEQILEYERYQSGTLLRKDFFNLTVQIGFRLKIGKKEN